ncbi:MAG: hypothetical protein JXR89_09710 [Deltaproteobacteria bacterium]|nr:hypothetical protein [Deltaproteobacteria bacterium]
MNANANTRRALRPWLRGLVFFLALHAASLPLTTRAAAPGERFSHRCIKILNQDDNGGPIQYPMALFFDRLREEVYAVCSGDRQMVIYTADFFPLISIGKGRGVKGIKSCALLRDQLLLCLSEALPDSGATAYLQLMDQALLPTGIISLTGFAESTDFSPDRVMVADDRIYLIGSSRRGVLVLDEQGGFIDEITPSKKVLGIREAASIQAFTHDGCGRLFLLSESMGAVFVYDKDGRQITQFGQKGGTAGKLSRPRGLAVDNRLNLVYVVDYMRHAVNVYNKNGDYLFEIGGQGVGRGWFSFPSDACVDNRGRLWVADTFNQRIQVFAIDKQPLPGNPDAAPPPPSLTRIRPEPRASIPAAVPLSPPSPPTPAPAPETSPVTGPAAGAAPMPFSDTPPASSNRKPLAEAADPGRFRPELKLPEIEESSIGSED